MKSYKSKEQGREWWRHHHYWQVEEQELLKEAEKWLSERYLGYIKVLKIYYECLMEMASTSLVKEKAHS